MKIRGVDYQLKGLVEVVAELVGLLLYFVRFVPFSVLFVAAVFFPGSDFTKSYINWLFVIGVLMFVLYWPIALLAALFRR